MRTRQQLLDMLAKGRAKRQANLAAKRNSGQNPDDKPNPKAKQNIQSKRKTKGKPNAVRKSVPSSWEIIVTDIQEMPIRTETFLTEDEAQQRYKEINDEASRMRKLGKWPKEIAEKPEAKYKNPVRKSFVGSVVKSFFPIAEFADVGAGIAGDVSRVVGNPQWETAHTMKLSTTPPDSYGQVNGPFVTVGSGQPVQILKKSGSGKKVRTLVQVDNYGTPVWGWVDMSSIRKSNNGYYTSPEYFTVESTTGLKRVLDRIYSDYASAARVASNYGAGWVIKQHKTMKAAEKRYKDYEKRVSKSNPKQKGNPSEDRAATLDQAHNLYESFHGSPSEYIETVTESVIIPSDFAELGTLVSIDFKSDYAGKACLTFNTNGNRTILGTDPVSHGLYLIGGDQQVSLKSLGITGDCVKPLVILGEISLVTYRTKKHFDDFETIDYYHKLGEESKVRPVLIYDTLNHKLSVAGGEYDIRPEGVTN